VGREPLPPSDVHTDEASANTTGAAAAAVECVASGTGTAVDAETSDVGAPADGGASGEDGGAATSGAAGGGDAASGGAGNLGQGCKVVEEPRGPSMGFRLLLEQIRPRLAAALGSVKS
jgi:hypothetical protein